MTAQTENLLARDVAIIGAGPIGLELAIGLKRLGVEYLHFDGGQVGQSIFNWPPRTRFFSSPERIAIAGVPIPNVDQEKITGEAYLAYLRAVVQQFDLPLQLYEPVMHAERRRCDFVLHTESRTGARRYSVRSVVLATGGMARPRKLAVPGEDLPHVSSWLGEPHRYFRTKLLIVGGRNSAVEAALRCWRVGAQVAISYRRAGFDPECVKPHLYAEVSGLVRDGQIAFYPETRVERIEPGQVGLAPWCADGPARTTTVPADFVLKCVGFQADMALFRELGIELCGTEEIPAYDPATMETNVPGVYVAGTAASGTQQQFRVFIETSHGHVPRILTHLQRRLALGAVGQPGGVVVTEGPPPGSPPSEREDFAS